MHSDWFNGIEILQGSCQHGEKVGYCYPSGLEKTLCKWDMCICPAGHERVKRIIEFNITTSCCDNVRSVNVNKIITLFSITSCILF
jgi:hypothetical protein